MGKFNDLTIKAVIEQLNEKYFLPDIQREYVWLSNEKDKKIEQLFDSILRGYPIGTFLFWKLHTDDVKGQNIQLYKFIQHYDSKEFHNEKIENCETDIKPGDLQIVLDGQQRLTSLFIGLKGSRKFHKKRSGKEIEEKKYLYLNLRHKPKENDVEDLYEFDFKSEEEVAKSDENNFWFKVGDILTIDSLFTYAEKNKLRDDEAIILEKLQKAIIGTELISFFEENEKNMDKVLNIFVRVNSGGVKLSYSDLLMSKLTAFFNNNIREKINEFIDDIKLDGFECFERDHLLKTSLLLIAADHKFVIKNFNNENLEKIKSNWNKITDKIKDTIKILKDYGYANRLSSGYIISIIALYLYKNNFNKISSEDKEEIWKFIRTAQIKSFFSTQTDTKIGQAKNSILNAKNFKDFNIVMAKEYGLKIIDDDIDNLLSLKYGKPQTLSVLQILYPNLNYKNNQFHIDHIFPKSKKQKDEIDRNFIFNLQLLEGSENQGKSDKKPHLWILEHFKNDEEKIKKYKEDNYIDISFDEWDNLDKFQEMRENKIRERLTEIIKESNNI